MPAGPEIGAALRREVAARAWQVCEYCLVQEDDLYHGLEVDHLISLKHGGVTAAENLALACLHCNRHKGRDFASVSALTGGLVRLYNSRTDRWPDHFAIRDGRIEPLTPVGEVTVRLLDFNHLERVAFRRGLAGAGRSPSVAALALLRG